MSDVLSIDLAIDLGSANTRVHVKDRGIVLQEPSVVAINNMTREVVAVGNEAKTLLVTHTTNSTVLRPMKDGVIADLNIAASMLRCFITKACNAMKSPPLRLVIIASSSGRTDEERKALREAAIQAGARDVYLISEPLAAAIGVGLPVNDREANMIVDIGAGTTKTDIICLSQVVYSSSIQSGGDKLDAAIISYVKQVYNIKIDEPTAEDIKCKIGSAIPLAQELTLEVIGVDLVSGLPKLIHLSSQNIREAMADTIGAITQTVRHTLERCPPELSADLMKTGLILSGGGALIRNLDKLLSSVTEIPVIVAKDPLMVVVNGTGIILQNSQWLDEVADNDD